jgi:hypothetical protein
VGAHFRSIFRGCAEHVPDERVRDGGLAASPDPALVPDLERFWSRAWVCRAFSVHDGGLAASRAPVLAVSREAPPPHRARGAVQRLRVGRRWKLEVTRRGRGRSDARGAEAKLEDIGKSTVAVVTLVLALEGASLPQVPCCPCRDRMPCGHVSWGRQVKDLKTLVPFLPNQCYGGR